MLGIEDGSAVVGTDDRDEATCALDAQSLAFASESGELYSSRGNVAS